MKEKQFKNAKSNDKVAKYGMRKLTIGLVSCMLGIFMLVSPIVNLPLSNNGNLNLISYAQDATMKINRPSISLGAGSPLFYGSYKLEFLGDTNNVLGEQNFTDDIQTAKDSRVLTIPRGTRKVRVTLPQNLPAEVNFSTTKNKTVEVDVVAGGEPQIPALEGVTKPSNHSIRFVLGSGADMPDNGNKGNPTPDTAVDVTHHDSKDKVQPLVSEIEPGAAINYTNSNEVLKTIEKKRNRLLNSGKEWAYNFYKHPFTNQWVRLGPVQGKDFREKLEIGLGLETQTLRVLMPKGKKYLNYIDIETGKALWTRDYSYQYEGNNVVSTNVALARGFLNTTNSPGGDKFKGLADVKIKDKAIYDYVGRHTTIGGQTGLENLVSHTELKERISTQKTKDEERLAELNKTIGNGVATPEQEQELNSIKKEIARKTHILELLEKGYGWEFFGGGVQGNKKDSMNTTNYGNQTITYLNIAPVTEEEKKHYENLGYAMDPIADNIPTMLEGVVATPGDHVFNYYYVIRRGFYTVNYAFEENGELKKLEESYVSDYINTGEEYDIKDQVKKVIKKDNKIYKLIEETGKTLPVEEGKKDNGKQDTPSSPKKGVITGAFDSQDLKPEITLVYKEVKPVHVEYVNKDNQPIKLKKTIEITEELDRYDTKTNELKPQVIEGTDGFKYRLVERKPDSAEEEGEFTEEEKTVVYVYEKVAPVTVKYVNKDKEEIQTSNVLTPKVENAQPEKYDTTKGDLKPKVIVTDKGDKYRFSKKDENSSDEQGDFSADPKTVTYVYEKVEPVTVKYVDEKGNPIQNDTVLKEDPNAQEPEAYSTETSALKPKVIVTDNGDKYRFSKKDENSSDEQGVFSADPKTVTYVYEKVEPVTVKYVDEDGNEIQNDTVLKEDPNAQEPEKYDTTNEKVKPKVIVKNGIRYELVKKSDDSAEEKGEFSKDAKVVTYEYKKVKGAVTVNYIDEAGNPIMESKVASTNEKSEYDTTTKELKPQIIEHEGFEYKFVKRSDNSAEEKGTVKGDESKSVTYEYKKMVGSVVVKYVDENGKPIKADENAKTNVSTKETYNTTTDELRPQIIDVKGVKYKLVKKVDGSDAEKGNVKEGETVVTYEYKKIAGSVLVNYVDEEGKTIKISEEVKPNEKSEYDTTKPELKPSTIEHDGFEYEFVEKTPDSDSDKGTVNGEEIKSVTYKYKKVTGSVIVKYVDDKGVPIKEEVKAKENSSTKETYDTTTDELRPQIITKEDGTVYKLVKKTADSAEEKGPIKKGETVVTYEYKKVIGAVVVNYVDEDGKSIKDSQEVKPNEKSEYNTAATEDLKPNKIEHDGFEYELVGKTKDSAEETGTLNGDEAKVVTYEYRKLKGSVIVKYVDENGKTIKADENAKTNASTKETYDTTTDKFKPTYIRKDGVLYVLLGVVEGSADEKGTVKDGELIVTYKYVKYSIPDIGISIDIPNVNTDKPNVDNNKPNVDNNNTPNDNNEKPNITVEEVKPDNNVNKPNSNNKPNTNNTKPSGRVIPKTGVESQIGLFAILSSLMAGVLIILGIKKRNEK